MADSSRVHGSGTEESLDELALSTLELPPSSPRRSKTPLAYKSPNVRTQYLNFDAAPTLRGTSPSKSMILETPAKAGSSPWRIKVTVQAEPNSDAPISETPSKPSARAPRGRKMFVPLKDADSPVKRGRGRPRKSEATPAASAIKKRKGTPMRRRSTRLSGDKSDFKGEKVDLSEKPAPKPRGRPRKSLLNVEVPADPPSPRSEQGAFEENVQTESVPPLSPFSDDQQRPDSPEAQQSLDDHGDEAVELSPPVERQPSPSAAPTLPSGHSNSQNELSTLSSHPYVYDLPPSEPPAIVTHGTSAKEAQPGTKSSSSAFPFADLTPLHKKYPLTKPTPAKFAPVFSRLKESGVVPDGWSRPVFSPIPARQLASQEIKTSRGSALSTMNNSRTPEAQDEAETHSEKYSSSGLSSIPVSENPDEHQQTEEQDIEEEEERNSLDQDNEEHQSSDHEDAAMWRHMVHTQEDGDDISMQGVVTSAGDYSDESDFGDGGMEFTGRPIGEQTMMQSEEFSMVSLDSLRELQSSFVDNSHVEEESNLPTKAASKLSQSWVPILTPNQTRPSIERSSHSKSTPLSKSVSSVRPSANNSSRKAKSSSRAPSSPALPRGSGSQVRANRVSSPKIARIAQASSTLQDVVSSPIQNLSRRSSIYEERSLPIPTRSSIFMSSPPNASTHLSPEDKYQTSRPKPPPSSILPSQTRLPTPNSLEQEPHGFGVPEAETEAPKLHLPPPVSVLESPAKSDGEMSWQTRTPPSTRGGTPSTSAEEQEQDEGEGEGEGRAMTSEPPSSQRRTPSSTKVIEKEAEWQRAREEVSRTIQSARASSVIVIESDKESEDEQEDEDDSDLWQEEASREEPSQLDHFRSMQHTNRSKLFSPVELHDQPRPHKVSRTWRRTSATDSSALDNTTHEQKQTRIAPLDDERSRQAANSAEIAALFKSLGGSKRYIEVTNGPKHATFLQDATMDQSPKESRHHRSSSALAPSPGKGILKRRLSFGNLHFPARDNGQEYSETQDTSFNTSFADTNASMASDVRQIRHELKAARRFANPQPARVETLKVPTKLRSVDDSIEEEQEYPETSTMLSITPKHTPKPLFPDTRVVEPQRRLTQVEDNSTPHGVTEKPVVAAVTTVAKATKQTAVAAPSILTRVWSYLPFGYAPPPRPTHPMLNDLPLLPRAEPWTRTHYLTVLRLYERYLRKPGPFSPSHPLNATLFTPRFIPYIDIEILRWGYYLKLNTSHIIIASLFYQLLVLKDIEEYKHVAGEDIDVGECLPSPAGEVINEWKCIKRLFSVITGKTLRRDEAEGKPIDRTGYMKWRFAGEEEWIVWGDGAFGSLSDGRGIPRM